MPQTTRNFAPSHLMESAHHVADQYLTHPMEKVREKIPAALEKVKTTTSHMPPTPFLALTVGSVVFSGAMTFRRLQRIDRKSAWALAGLWAPSLLLAGVYGKLLQNYRSNPSNGPRTPDVIYHPSEVAAGPRHMSIAEPRKTEADDFISYKSATSNISPSGKGTGGYSY
ncbi:MAG: hypothetical protein H7222_18335 [Methylotenera sp.]|nr:hypothetical protein [Oligoflexia bacterium]